MSLLRLEGISAGYSGSTIIEDMSIEIEQGAVVSLLGRNGVGKTTTLRTIVGLLSPTSGTIYYGDEDITDLKPHEIYSRGLIMVPEDRGIFPELTVGENLHVPIIRNSGEEYTVSELFELFPRLEERKKALGGNLSGGEMQMLAIARALRSKPELLLLDEPGEGLAPQIIDDVAEIIKDISDRGTTILLVEQNIDLAFELSSYGYIMDLGEVVLEGPSKELRHQEDQLEQYLGVHE